MDAAYQPMLTGAFSSEEVPHKDTGAWLERKRLESGPVARPVGGALISSAAPASGFSGASVKHVALFLGGAALSDGLLWQRFSSSCTRSPDLRPCLQQGWGLFTRHEIMECE